MRVVLDTNVVVSAFLSTAGAPARVLDLWRRQDFQVVVSEPLLEEYRRALLYERVASRHGMGVSDITEVVEGFREFAVLVTPGETISAIQEDPQDNRVLECALAGGAAYVVSGDYHLLKLKAFRDIQILSSSQFLAVLEEEQGVPSP